MDDAAVMPTAAVRRAVWVRLTAALMVSVLVVVTAIASLGGLRSVDDRTPVAPAAAAVGGRIESFIDVSHASEAFVAPAAPRPVLRALPRSGFALWLLLLAALATLGALVGLRPGHRSARDARAIEARWGAARLPRRRGPPVLTS